MKKDTQLGRYKRNRLGSPHDNPAVKLRFYSFIDIPENEDSCWLWSGYKDADGYGKFTYDKRQRSSHRVMWELENRLLEPGEQILHDPLNCNNPSCVNPNHLRVGSHWDNEDDKIKRASSKGIHNPGYAVKLENHSRYVHVDDATASEIIRRIRVDNESKYIVANDYPFSVTVIRRLLSQFDGEYKKLDIYIASGFFDEDQLAAVKKIEAACKKNDINFFSPRLEGGIIKNMTKSERIKLNRKIFELNVDAIERCDCIIAIIDNYDSGTVWEIGFGYGKKKEIITVTNNNYGLNVMLSDAVLHHTGSAEDAVNAFLGKDFDELKIIANT